MNISIHRSISIIAVLSSLLVPKAWAYEHHDVTQIIRSVEGPKGTQRQLDLAVVDAIIDDLSRHAGSYPTHFGDRQEQQRATQDASKLSGLLNILTSSGTASPELLIRVGRLNAMANNLDVPSAAQRAEAAYRQLLTLQPEHAQGNYGFGLFLTSTARGQAAIPYLKKAMAKGVDAAPYTLGLAYLTLNDKRKALMMLDGYAKTHPKDVAAKELVQAVLENSN